MKVGILGGAMAAALAIIALPAAASAQQPAPVRATSVIVCEGGMVRGDIKADSIAVYGVVTGNLNGGHVLLCAGCTVDGEIRHAGLGIDPGANFEGTIRRVAVEAQVAAE